MDSHGKRLRRWLRPMLRAKQWNFSAYNLATTPSFFEMGVPVEQNPKATQRHAHFDLNLIWRCRWACRSVPLRDYFVPLLLGSELDIDFTGMFGGGSIVHLGPVESLEQGYRFFGRRFWPGTPPPKGEKGHWGTYGEEPASRGLGDPAISKTANGHLATGLWTIGTL